MYKLSIVTIVKDDYDGLIDTIRSVDYYAPDNQVQHVVWICALSTNIEKFYLITESTRRKVLIKDDRGIWDAMNNAMDHASGKLLLFLNAKDVLTAPLDVNSIDSGCLLPVEYVDWFGRLRRVKCNSDLRHGIPYCHQGVIFPSTGLKYDTRFKFGADYLYILDSFHSWPPPLIDHPIVRYDNSGVSSERRFEADLWAVKCVYVRFGFSAAIYVLARSVAKLLVRLALLPLRGAIGRRFS